MPDATVIVVYALVMWFVKNSVRGNRGAESDATATKHVLLVLYCPFVNNIIKCKILPGGLTYSRFCDKNRLQVKAISAVMAWREQVAGRAV